LHATHGHLRESVEDAASKANRKVLAVNPTVTFIDAMRNLPCAVFVVTPEGAIVDANPAGLRMAGLAAIDGEIKLASLVVNSEDELGAFLRICNQSASPVRGELVWRTSGGAAPVELTAWRAGSGKKSKSAALILQCDARHDDESSIQELQRKVATLKAENLENRRCVRELAAALQARADFIARAAHEIRNPLNVFHLTLQLLYLKPKQSEDDLRALLDRLRAQLNRITSLVDHLLDLSRFRSGKFNLEPEPFDLGDLAREVVERFSGWHPNVAFRLDVEGETIGTWDRHRIGQALANLVSNAIKYGNNSPISVAVTSSGGEVLVSVHDEGIGIPTSDSARIFQRFESPAIQPGVDGVGLGLLIARLNVEAHGGRISAESIEHGATFTVRLPLKTAAIRSLDAQP
jgi:signal transduction histidine kinase